MTKEKTLYVFGTDANIFKPVVGWICQGRTYRGLATVYKYSIIKTNLEFQWETTSKANICLHFYLILLFCQLLLSTTPGALRCPTQADLMFSACWLLISATRYPKLLVGRAVLLRKDLVNQFSLSWKWMNVAWGVFTSWGLTLTCSLSKKSLTSLKHWG